MTKDELIENIFEEVVIDEDTLHEIQSFAETIDTAHYGKRDGQTNELKRKKDQFIAKMGEWIAYYKLKEQLFPDISAPDMEIYEARKKNWNPDLQERYFSFGVKSCEDQGTRSTWVFEIIDKEVFGEIHPEHMIVFVTVNPQECSGKIASIVPVYDLHEHNQFLPLRKKSLNETKKAVYYTGLKIAQLYGKLPDEFFTTPV